MQKIYLPNITFHKTPSVILEKTAELAQKPPTLLAKTFILNYCLQLVTAQTSNDFDDTTLFAQVTKAGLMCIAFGAVSMLMASYKRPIPIEENNTESVFSTIQDILFACGVILEFFRNWFI